MSNWGEECPLSLARCGAHFLQHMFWSLCGNLFLEQLVGNKGHLLLVEGMSDLLHLGSLILKFEQQYILSLRKIINFQAPLVRFSQRMYHSLGSLRND